MSYVYPSEYQSFVAPTTAESSTGGSSCIWWIVAFVLFLLVAIGLAIWLIVLYLGGHVGGSNNRSVTLQGGSITAEANSITGTWTTLNNDSDKVTLYVSEKPFVFNDTGNVVDNNGSVQHDFKVGPNGKIDIAVKNNTSYNAMMIVTGNDTVHYRVFGPKRVFTQVTANIIDRKFHVQNLNSCNGAVSKTATYTTAANDFGIYSLGSTTNTNQDGKLLLLNHDEETEDETSQVLCRIEGTNQSTKVNFGYWINKGNTTEKPVICTVPNSNNDELTATQCTQTSDKISLEDCQWSYNANPPLPNMAGLNQWCLSALGSTTSNNVKEPLCLSINGQALAVTNGQINTDTWFNQILN